MSETLLGLRSGKSNHQGLCCAIIIIMKITSITLWEKKVDVRKQQYTKALGKTYHMVIAFEKYIFIVVLLYKIGFLNCYNFLLQLFNFLSKRIKK